MIRKIFGRFLKKRNSKRAVFDEPELEAAWRQSAKLSKKNGTKFRY
ncbi:MAG: hypothetical protein HY517_00380 [Candidatus Aenigmarchaeota archaeon]|nr:hypothetical protein [Candidatus Aenigmarchaeota archaeon]